MARKADLDLVKLVLNRNELEVRKIAQIIEDISKELAKLDEEEKPPTVKKQFVMLVSDPEGDMPNKDLTGWVLQIPEEESPLTVEERLIESAYEYNRSPKGKVIPVQTIGEACEILPPRVTKERQVWIKSKEPLIIVKTNNQIPTD